MLQRKAGKTKPLQVRSSPLNQDVFPLQSREALDLGVLDRLQVWPRGCIHVLRDKVKTDMDEKPPRGVFGSGI